MWRLRRLIVPGPSSVGETCLRLGFGLMEDVPLFGERPVSASGETVVHPKRERGPVVESGRVSFGLFSAVGGGWYYCSCARSPRFRSPLDLGRTEGRKGKSASAFSAPRGDCPGGVNGNLTLSEALTTLFVAFGRLQI